MGSATSWSGRYRKPTASVATRPTGKSRTGSACTRRRGPNERRGTMRTLTSGIVCAAALCVFAAGAQANDPNKQARDNEYKAAVAHADAEYKAAKEGCSARQGNDKDVCLKEAAATHTAAVEDAKAHRKANAAMADARDEKMEAQYKVAKEKCDALSGSAKDSCIADAKLKYHQ